ncbi:MAG: FHA domain-containing protein [Desulfosarcina sp.]|nr:FHA domain-containing protein [Desulfobacterales bacterium]
MRLIGLEINDAGILCVDSNGRLQPAEATETTSPGFALVEGRDLQLGTPALRQARRRPRQTNCRFWDQLNAQPLLSPEFQGYSHGELAYRHLERVWAQIKTDDAEVGMTVPDHYQDKQLGLLLGLTSALAIPVSGLISQALACVPPETAGGVYFHLDVQLHRLTLTAVDGRPRPAVCRHESIMEAGLEAIQRQWVKTLADTFVRQTRFDPLYSADSEQTLHDCLAGLSSQPPTDDPLIVEMQAAGRTHRIQLDRDALMAPYPSWIEILRGQIKIWRDELAVAPEAPRLLVTHRLAGLPGFVQQLERATGLTARRLIAGTAAANALAYADRFAESRSVQGVPYLNRVAAPPTATTEARTTAAEETRPARPTHLVYRGWAYPISERPLVVGRELPQGTGGIRIRGHLAGISRCHFTVVRQDHQVLLTDTSSYGTLVDDVPVSDRTALAVGQTLRIGTPGETLQAIACLRSHETTTA